MNVIGEVVAPLMKKSHSISSDLQLHALLKNPVVQDFSQIHPNITLDDYKRSWGRLVQLVTETENCKHCRGLDQCTNMVVGHTPTLVSYAGCLDLRLKPCLKLKAKEEEENRKNLIRSHSIPKDIINASFATINPDSDRMEVIEAAIDFCAQFAEKRPNKGLYLSGPLGVGKSRIAGAIVNELTKYNVDSFMFYVPEFMREVSDSIHDNSLYEKLNLLKQVSVLILDDIGAEFLTPWKRDEILGAVLQYRSSENLPTIYTSNLALDELEEHLANTNKGLDWMKAKRIMERIRHYVTPFHVSGGNWRENS